MGIGKDACPMEEGDVSLRQWLDKPERIIDHSKSLHIFRQIVETVDLAHSQGVVINNVRPSCFVMSSFNRVSFIESASSSDSDSAEDALNNKGERSTGVSSRVIAPTGVSQRASETSCLRSTSAFQICKSSIEEIEERNSDASRKLEDVDEMKKNFPLKQILSMEISWYTSPEEADSTPSSYASDIYRLGVLLFELFCTFSSMGEKLQTMSNLRHRVLPPQLLLKWPKEASFCLWLLHPQPSSRPKMSEVLHSEFLIEPRDSMEEREAALKVKEESEEQDLLQEFLLQMQLKKQEAADKHQSIISLLSSDIEEVLKQRSVIENMDRSYPKQIQDSHSVMDKVEYPSLNPDRNNDSTEVESRKRFRSELWSHEKFNEHSGKVQRIRSGTQIEHQETVLSKSSRLMKNFKKLESAYFSTRLRLTKPPKLPSRYSGIRSGGRGSTAMTDSSSVDNLSFKDGHIEVRKTGWIHPFLDSLSKYLSYSKLKLKADLKQGDLLNSSNLGSRRPIKFFQFSMLPEF